MSLWTDILKSMNDISIDNIRIRDSSDPKNNIIWFETTLDINTNDMSYEGTSYMKHPGNVTHSWPEDYHLKELQYDLPGKLNELAYSQHLKDNLLSTAITSAIYSKIVSEYPYKSETDIMQLIKEGDSILFVDNYGVDGDIIERNLEWFIKTMRENHPKEIHILQDNKLYSVSPGTGKISISYADISEIYPDNIIISNCFYSSIKQMDENLEELFSYVNHENAQDIALIGPLIVVDPDILFKEYRKYGVNIYATSQYPQKTKVVCTPTAHRYIGNKEKQITTFCR